MKTKAQLSLAVARRLKLVDALNSVPAEDAAYIESEYDTLHAKWVDREMVYWTNTDRATEEIPDAAFQSLADMVAGHCAGGFGKDEPAVADETGRQMPMSVRGWRDLKRHVRVRADGLPTKATYF